MTQLQVSVAFRPAGGLNSRVVRLVLFDIDGTLICTGGAGVKAFGRAVVTEVNMPDGADDRNQLAALAGERGSRLLNDHLRGGQILVIGDTPRDVECARAIDARMLAVTTGGAEWEDLEPHRPDLLVRDLTQVTARDVCS